MAMLVSGRVNEVINGVPTNGPKKNGIHRG